MSFFIALLAALLSLGSPTFGHTTPGFHNAPTHVTAPHAKPMENPGGPIV